MAHSHSGNRDEGVIDLRGSGDEPEFKIGNLNEDNFAQIDRMEAASDSKRHEALASAVATEPEVAAAKPYDKVKVKFNKFVNLIATHAYQEIFDKHEDDDVVISTDLLTDLANAHEEKEDGKKVPLVFIVGILLGIALTYLLLNK